MKEYTIYGTTNCGFCNDAKSLLDDKGLPYCYMDAPSSLFFQREFKDKGIRTVPQIFVTDTEGNERHIGGFQELAGELL